MAMVEQQFELRAAVADIPLSATPPASPKDITLLALKGAIVSKRKQTGFLDFRLKLGSSRLQNQIDPSLNLLFLSLF